MRGARQHIASQQGQQRYITPTQFPVEDSSITHINNTQVHRELPSLPLVHQSIRVNTSAVHAPTSNNNHREQYDGIAHLSPQAIRASTFASAARNAATPAGYVRNSLNGQLIKLPVEPSQQGFMAPPPTNPSGWNQHWERSDVLSPYQSSYYRDMVGGYNSSGNHIRNSWDPAGFNESYSQHHHAQPPLPSLRVDSSMYSAGHNNDHVSHSSTFPPTMQQYTRLSVPQAIVAANTSNFGLLSPDINDVPDQIAQNPSRRVQIHAGSSTPRQMPAIQPANAPTENKPRRRTTDNSTNRPEEYSKLLGPNGKNYLRECEENGDLDCAPENLRRHARALGLPADDQRVLRAIRENLRQKKYKKRKVEKRAETIKRETGRILKRKSSKGTTTDQNTGKPAAVVQPIAPFAHTRAGGVIRLRRLAPAPPPQNGASSSVTSPLTAVNPQQSQHPQSYASMMTCGSANQTMQLGRWVAPNLTAGIDGRPGSVERATVAARNEGYHLTDRSHGYMLPSDNRLSHGVASSFTNSIAQGQSVHSSPQSSSNNNQTHRPFYDQVPDDVNGHNDEDDAAGTSLAKFSYEPEEFKE